MEAKGETRKECTSFRVNDPVHRMWLGCCCAKGGSRKIMVWEPTWHDWLSEKGTSSTCDFCVCHEGSLNMTSFHILWRLKVMYPRVQVNKVGKTDFQCSPNRFPPSILLIVSMCVCAHMWSCVCTMDIYMLQVMDRFN